MPPCGTRYKSRPPGLAPGRTALLVWWWRKVGPAPVWAWHGPDEAAARTAFLETRVVDQSTEPSRESRPERCSPQRHCFPALTKSAREAPQGFAGRLCVPRLRGVWLRKVHQSHSQHVRAFIRTAQLPHDSDAGGSCDQHVRFSLQAVWRTAFFTLPLTTPVQKPASALLATGSDSEDARMSVAMIARM
jgi:hypothetical protein